MSAQSTISRASAQTRFSFSLLVSCGFYCSPLFSTVYYKLLLSWGGQASPKFVKAAKRKISREDIEWHLERRDSFADIDS